LILPHIIEIANICAAQGITDAVISPGSRSAAISLAFEAQPSIKTRVIIDERSAAFIAMGMAQQQQRPVVLICTSGSASLNYAPAIAEAYYQEIPLIVLTADRPPEWIDQYDGQTINQQGIYGAHVLSSFQFPVDPQHRDAQWHANRIVNQAILSATDAPSGPVHINVPIREPFYPEKNEQITPETDPRIVLRAETTVQLTDQTIIEYAHAWEKAKEKWIIIGQTPPNDKLSASLRRLMGSATIINEVTGNQHDLPEVVVNQDLIFKGTNHELIPTPDLLITIGNSLISKSLKLFLRKHPPKTHWHIKRGERFNDSLQHLTAVIPVSPHVFLEQLAPALQSVSVEKSLLNRLEDEIQKKKEAFLKTVGFGELSALDQVLKRLPQKTNLHLANSMSVRYVNYLGGIPPATAVYCNRGTSGIDGSNSTAVGASLVTDKLNILITGDLAFFYDRNAFWHQEDISNLRVILLNNNGGGIFNMIPGPKGQSAHEKLFLTPHGLNASFLAKEFGMIHYEASTPEDLKTTLTTFFNPSDKPKILEISSTIETNTTSLEQLKKL